MARAEYLWSDYLLGMLIAVNWAHRFIEIYESDLSKELWVLGGEVKVL